MGIFASHFPGLVSRNGRGGRLNANGPRRAPHQRVNFLARAVQHLFPEHSAQVGCAAKLAARLVPLRIGYSNGQGLKVSQITFAANKIHAEGVPLAGVSVAKMTLHATFEPELTGQSDVVERTILV